MAKIQINILYRHQETGEIEPRSVAYDGNIPEKVWKRLNIRLLKLDAGNYFYPCDAMDAYQYAIHLMESVADQIASGKLVLEKASPETYLTGVVYKSLYHFHLRKVLPMRKTYRAVERQTMGVGAIGEDGFDIDNYDGTQDNPDKTMTDACGEQCVESIPVGVPLTAQQLVESLPGVPYMVERCAKAMMLLEDVCEAMRRADPRLEEAIDAFAAYVAAEANMVQAAYLLHVSKTAFYRKWPRYLAAAKATWEKRAELRH